MPSSYSHRYVTPRTRKILAQVGSFALAGVLLYLALRGVDFSEVGAALKEANYWWTIPMGVALLFSHWLRAWRWQVLLEALPPKHPEAGPQPVSRRVAFYSVMIGYMVNYAAPRLGEVARTANLASQEKLPFTGVLGTVVVERILDVLVLLFGLASVFVLLFDRFGAIQDLFIAPIQDRLGEGSVWILLALLVGVTLALGLLFVGLLRRKESRFALFWSRRVAPLLISFKDGLATVLRSQRRLFLACTTAGIWLCYLASAYLPFLMFGMTEAFGLSLMDAWSIMMLGAIGVAIPSPGGVGSFHYITIQTLILLFGVDQATAATYAVFVHGGQLVLYVAVGFICILLQGSRLGVLRDATQVTQTKSDDVSSPVPPVPDEKLS